MFRAQYCAILGFGLMLAAASTEARELEFSIENRIVADSNVFRTSSDRIEDGSYVLSPRISVSQKNSRLNYSLSYQPIYEAFFTTSGINGFDHWGQANFSWRPTAVDTLSFDGNYASRRTLRIENFGSGAPLETSDRERVQRADARLSYRHALSQVLSVDLTAAFQDLDYSRNTSIDSRFISGRLGGQYVLTPVTLVGLSGTIRQRENLGGDSQLTTETTIWDLAASVQRNLTPTLVLSVQAGPSFIRTKQKFPNPIPLPDEKSRSTSFFAVASLEKRWQRSNFTASYTRSESNGSGTTASSINDYISLDFTHRLDRRWSFGIFGSWLESEEITSLPGGRRQKTTQYRAFVSLTRKVARRVSVTTQFSIFDQDENGSTGSGSIGRVYSGFLSLRYTFDPVVF